VTFWLSGIGSLYLAAGDRASRRGVDHEKGGFEACLRSGNLVKPRSPGTNGSDADSCHCLRLLAGASTTCALSDAAAQRLAHCPSIGGQLRGIGGRDLPPATLGAYPVVERGEPAAARLMLPASSVLARGGASRARAFRGARASTSSRYFFSLTSPPSAARTDLGRIGALRRSMVANTATPPRGAGCAACGNDL
jgi:hypothetical protein